MKKIKLDNCRFCRAGAYIADLGFNYFKTVCNECGAQGPLAKTKGWAIEYWNKGIDKGIDKDKF